MPGFPEAANISITTIAVVLNELFGKYTQFNSLEETEEVSTGQLTLPLLAFEQVRLYLKSTSIKNTYLVGRLSVYSKQPEDEKPCNRFILEHRCKSLEEILKLIPAPIKDATFIKDGDITLMDILLKLSGIPGDKISYFYSLNNCEGVNTHCLAVVHEFGKENDPLCVVTSYFKVDVTK